MTNEVNNEFQIGTKYQIMMQHLLDNYNVISIVPYYYHGVNDPVEKIFSSESMTIYMGDLSFHRFSNNLQMSATMLDEFEDDFKIIADTIYSIAGGAYKSEMNHESLIFRAITLTPNVEHIEFIGYKLTLKL